MEVELELGSITLELLTEMLDSLKLEDAYLQILCDEAQHNIFNRQSPRTRHDPMFRTALDASGQMVIDNLTGDVK